MSDVWLSENVQQDNEKNWSESKTTSDGLNNNKYFLYLCNDKCVCLFYQVMLALTNRDWSQPSGALAFMLLTFSVP